MHPSPRKSAHSSQLVPLGKVHIPYSDPSGFFMISTLPPISSQYTEAGFGIPGVGAVVATGVWTGAAGWWVQPQMRTAARRMKRTPIKGIFRAIILNQGSLGGGNISTFPPRPDRPPTGPVSRHTVPCRCRNSGFHQEHAISGSDDCGSKQEKTRTPVA